MNTFTQLQPILQNLSVTELVKTQKFLEKYIPETCKHENFKTVYNYGDAHFPDPKYQKKCEMCKLYIDFTYEETEKYNEEQIKETNEEFDNYVDENGNKCRHEEYGFYLSIHEFVGKWIKCCRKCHCNSYNITDNDLRFVNDKIQLKDYADSKNLELRITKKDGSMIVILPQWLRNGTKVPEEFQGTSPRIVEIDWTKKFKYVLKIGGNVVQVGDKMEDITLLNMTDNNGNKLIYHVPFHWWTLTTHDNKWGKWYVEKQECINEELELNECYANGFKNDIINQRTESYNYFDGISENKLLISGGMAIPENPVDIY